MVPMKTNAAKSWLFDKTVGDMFDAACQKVWNAIVSMLQQVMGFMDKVGHVNVQTTAGNPLAQVYPVTMWIGAALAILLGIMGAGAFAWTKGRNGAQMLTGFVKFAVGWAAALTLVNLLAGVADQLAVGILRTGRISGWSAVAGQQSWLAKATGQGVTPIVAVLIGCVFLFPATIAFLAESVVRAAGVEIIAATLPILLAGALWQGTSRWLALGIKWLLALIFMPPAIALTIVIGLSIMRGTGAGSGFSGLGQLLVGSVTLALSLFAPFLLFKLFAFVEPAVGAAVAGGFGVGSGSGHSATTMSVEGDSDGQDGVEEAAQTNVSRMTNGGSYGESAANLAQGTAFPIMDAVGAGHQMGGAGSTGNDDSDDDQQQRNRDDQQPDEPDEPGTEETPVNPGQISPTEQDTAQPSAQTPGQETPGTGETSTSTAGPTPGAGAGAGAEAAAEGAEVAGAL